MAKKKDQQAHLPTMEPPKLPAVDAAAKRYAEARDERMGAGKQERECKVELLGMLANEGITEYENGDVWIKVEKTEKLRVRIGGVDGEDEDDEDE